MHTLSRVCHYKRSGVVVFRTFLSPFPLCAEIKGEGSNSADWGHHKFKVSTKSYTLREMI